MLVLAYESSFIHLTSNYWVSILCQALIQRCKQYVGEQDRPNPFRSGDVRSSECVKALNIQHTLHPQIHTLTGHIMHSLFFTYHLVHLSILVPQIFFIIFNGCAVSHYMNPSFVYSPNNNHLDYFQYSSVTNNGSSMICANIPLLINLEVFPVFYLKIFNFTNNFAKLILYI